MSEGLIGDKRRQATDSIRGYVYQAYQSVLAWIRLQEDEVLFLEGAEDFDVHNPERVTATQVKDTAGSGTVTLRSRDIVAAINNLWRHKQNNRDKNVRLRFLTTATPGREQGVAFGQFSTGLEYWACAKRDQELSLEPLKSLLLTLDLEPSLADFLRNSNDQAVRENLICCIDWDTGRKPIDGLAEDIKDRLVCFGDSRGIDSYQSEKVLNTLLRRVADLLSSNGERHLGYADFVREFEQATMELVSREEAVANRTFTGQIARLLQTSIAPRVLDSPVRLMEGAAPRTDLVLNLTVILRRYGVLFLRGSTGLGKTSLAQLLMAKIESEWVWAGFRGREPRQIADHLKRAAVEIKTHDLPLRVVLDDLDLGSLAQFERELLSLVFSISNQNGVVIITGPTACPPELLAKLWLPQDCDREIPYFNESDVRDVLISHGLSDETLLEQWSRLTWLLTAGHPQLIHARVRNLQAKGWPPVVATDVLEQGDLEHVRTTARRRLLDELPSEGARYMAYRLSLIINEFSRQTMLDLAQLPPQVVLPGEVFDGLLGPWIETLGDDRYRVSPLLRDAGSQVLSEPEQVATHGAIALGFLKRRTITPYQFGTALMHACIAKSDDVLVWLAGVMLTSGPEDLGAISDAVSWFPAMALVPGQQLSPNPATDFTLRLAQFRIASAGRQTDRALIVMDRALELLEQIDHEEIAKASKVMAYATFLNTIEIPIPPRRAINMIAGLMEFEESDESLAEITKEFDNPSLPYSGLSLFQTLFTLAGARISGIDDLDVFLDALSALNENKRQHLIEAWENDTRETIHLLIGSSWWHDASRDVLDISRAVATFRKSIDLGKAWSSPNLVRASYVAISVLYDEYGNSSDDALDVLDEVTKDFSTADPYLLAQRGKVLFHQQNYEAAVSVFDQVLTEEGPNSVDRAFAGRTGGIAAARLGAWDAAERFFLLGASAAGEVETLKSMTAGLKADAAFARWKQGHYADALRLYAEVLELLEEISIDEDLRSRHIHASVRYCLFWVDIGESSTSETGLVEPPPGVCSNPEPHEGLQDYSIIDVSVLWGLLGNIDTKLGTGLGLTQQVEKKYNGALSLIIRVGERFAHYQNLWKGTDILRAVPIIIGMMEGDLCISQLDASPHDQWEPGDIAPLPSNYWEDQSNRNTLLISLIAAAVVATHRHPDSPLPIEEWRNDVSQYNIIGTDVDRFFSLLTSSEEETDGSLLEEAALAIRRSRDNMLPPRELLRHHFRLWIALVFRFSGDSGKPVGDALAKMVTSHWLRVSDNQRFALISPSHYAPLLKEKCEDLSRSGFSQVASVLKTASTAVGVRLANDVFDLLTKVERGEAATFSAEEGLA